MISIDPAGNSKLLELSEEWKVLIDSYSQRDCMWEKDRFPMLALKKKFEHTPVTTIPFKIKFNIEPECHFKQHPKLELMRRSEYVVPSPADSLAMENVEGLQPVPAA